MFCSRGGKERWWPWMFLFYSPPFLILPLSGYPHVCYDFGDLWHCINIFLTWITLSIHGFSQRKKKHLLLFPNFNRGKLRAVLVLISGSDHLYDRLSASFHLFLLFQQEFTEMDSPLCACIWSLTRFSIECCLVSLTANTLLCYALLTWNVACRDSWTWAS